MKCFYHSADLDGHCSGAIVKSAFPECQMIGINYGDVFPWDTIMDGENVWMVDFSLQPFSDMERLNEMASLTWIDHHKTSLAEASARGFSAKECQRLDNESAACELTWWRCYPNIPLPRGVFFLGRYDIWKHADHPGALEFQYGMRFQEDTKPENQHLWNQVIADHEYVTHLIGIGGLLLTYEDRQNAKYCASCAFEVQFDGLRCIAINKGLTGSLSFKSIYDPAKHDAMLSFVMRKFGQWTVSLYADKPEVDCSAICKARGGGGHKGAAGFVCSTLPF